MSAITRRPVALIVSDAVRDVAECEEQLAEIVRSCEAALERAKADQKEAHEILVGLRKLHGKATKRTRDAEQRSLRRAADRTDKVEPAGPRPKEQVLECLRGSLNLLTKEEIQEHTGLEPRAVGVVCGHLLRAGKIIEREGLYGVAQQINQALKDITEVAT